MKLLLEANAGISHVKWRQLDALVSLPPQSPANSITNTHTTPDDAYTLILFPSSRTSPKAHTWRNFHPKKGRSFVSVTFLVSCSVLFIPFLESIFLVLLRNTKSGDGILFSLTGVRVP